MRALPSLSRLLAAVAVLPLAAVVLASGCTPLPDVPSQVCGNGVLETGEECDSTEAGCGAHDGPAPCRFVCSPTVTCTEPSYVCGPDQICRQPTGSYTLSSPYGVPGDKFEIVDIDHDGFPDIGERGLSDARYYRNDHGTLVSYAAGTINPDGTVVRAFALGPFAPGDDRPVLAVISSVAVNIFTVNTDQGIAPLVVPTSMLPVAADALQLLGTLRFAPGEPISPLIYDPARHAVVAYGYDDVIADEAASVDVAPCGANAGSKLGTAFTNTNTGSLVALLVDNRSVCMITATEVDGTPTLTAVPLDTTKLAAFDPRYTINNPVFADVIGARDPNTNEPIHDLVALLQTANGDFHFVFWGRALDQPTYGAASVGDSYTPYYSYLDSLLTAGDFTGDGYDDIVDNDVLLTNAKGGMDNKPGFIFKPAAEEELNDNIVYFGPARVAADLNGDHALDMALTTTSNGVVATCFGNGQEVPAFSCFYTDTLVPSVVSLSNGDFNGDLTSDLAVLGAPPPLSQIADLATNADPENQIRIIYGRGLSLPDLLTVPLQAYHGTVLQTGASIGISMGAGYAPNLANELVAAVSTGGKIGVAQGNSYSGTPPAFGVNVPTFETRFVGNDIIMLRCDVGPTDHYDDCKMQVYHGSDGGAAFATDDQRPFSRSLPAGSDAYSTGIRLMPVPDDDEPAVLWAEPNGVVVGHYNPGAGKYIFTLAAAQSGTIADAVSFSMQDIDGPKDPGGDGRQEIVVQTLGSDGGCRFLAGRFDPGAPAPDALDLLCTLPACIGAPMFSDTDDYGHGAPFFGLSASSDAPSRYRDLYAVSRDSDGVTSHLAVFVAGTDGMLASTPTLDPPRFHLSADGPLVALPHPDDYRWIETVDMDGDNIPDLLFRSSNGLVIAFADVVRR